MHSHQKKPYHFGAAKKNMRAQAMSMQPEEAKVLPVICAEANDTSRATPTGSSGRRRHKIRAIALTMSFVAAIAIPGVCAQPAVNFSGRWTQDNDRCQPKRNGNVTLHIEHHDPELTVETLISRGSLSSGHAMQKYTTDGRVSASTGADGDEFHTSAVWKDSSLIFTIEEHEVGRILHSQETWALIENGAMLQRIRERPNGEKQIFFYRRKQAGPGELLH
jgi:hypothetical protein